MSKRTTKFLIVFGLLLALSALLAACSGATQVSAPTQGPAPTQACPDCPKCPEAQPCPTAAPAVEGVTAPYEDVWAASPHNDTEAMAFNDWNDTEAKAVPANCAQCHSTTGYVDFLGGDGSEAGKVDAPVPVGETITCDACHAEAAVALTSVTFPSGEVVSDLGPEARCMVCHQGRASTTSVNAQIERFSAEDPDRAPLPITSGDTTSRFGFINIHYYAAAATLYGTEAKGGYEYPGKMYDAKFDHTEGYDTCVGCHDMHSTEVKVGECALCHEGVATVEDLKAIRMVSSAPDYDGDGNVEEGMYDEMMGLKDTLYGAIVMYAKDLQGTGIVYDEAAYPYWFNDRDGDGKPDVDDKGANQAYNTWTPRLLKAAYNFQVATKDPGAFAHGNKYITQLLFDSIADLNASAMPNKVDMSAMHRDDAGHFAGNTEAFRHWDEEEMTVPGTCAKCHAAGGLPQFIANGTNVAMHASNGFQCSTCHNEAEWPATYAVNTVTFPSGKAVGFGEGAPANLCLACHQGRESTVSVNNALKAFTNPDEVSDKIRFRNVHYFAAGATLFGSEVQGIYQYQGKEYSGQFQHNNGTLNTCTDCHDKHVLAIDETMCAGCHVGQTLETLRMDPTDFDGDGDVAEGLKGELANYQAALLAAIQAEATKLGTGILYDAAAYPYWFVDANGDGKADTNAEGAAIGYNAFSPSLVKAAYNYQYSQKDPGAFAHNFTYVAQALYDSIEDLGGDKGTLTRPAVK